MVMVNHDDVERPRAQAREGELGEPHVQLSRLRLRKHRADVARYDLAAREDVREKIDPLAFDSVSDHGRGSRILPCRINLQ